MGKPLFINGRIILGTAPSFVNNEFRTRRTLREYGKKETESGAEFGIPRVIFQKRGIDSLSIRFLKNSIRGVFQGRFSKQSFENLAFSSTFEAVNKSRKTAVHPCTPYRLLFQEPAIFQLVAVAGKADSARLIPFPGKLSVKLQIQSGLKSEAFPYEHKKAARLKDCFFMFMLNENHHLFLVLYFITFLTCSFAHFLQKFPPVLFGFPHFMQSPATMRFRCVHALESCSASIPTIFTSFLHSEIA
jgi:hypothetical protein